MPILTELATGQDRRPDLRRSQVGLLGRGIHERRWLSLALSALRAGGRAARSCYWHSRRSESRRLVRTFVRVLEIRGLRGRFFGSTRFGIEPTGPRRCPRLSPLGGRLG